MIFLFIQLHIDILIYQSWFILISDSSDTLFELWNKYEPKLSKEYYQSKLLEVGDFLVLVKVSNKTQVCYVTHLYVV